MIARAPLLIFYAVSATLLPHLSRMWSHGEATSEEAFRLSIRGTLRAVAGFAALAVLVLAAAGPELMQLAFGENFSYDRLGLVIVAVGMGFYLAATTLSQAALARDQAMWAAACFFTCSAAFVVWSLLPLLDPFRRVEVGFAGAAVALCSLLYGLYRWAPAAANDVAPSGSVPRPGRWPPPPAN